MRARWSPALLVVWLAACSEAALRHEPSVLPGGGYVSLVHYGTNPVIDSDEQPFVRIGLSADRASWVLVRHYLERDVLPPPEAVRVEDCIAAMAPEPAPPRGRAMSIAVTVHASPFRAGWQALVIAIATPPSAQPEVPAQVLSETPDGALERALVARGAMILRGDARALPGLLDAGGPFVLVSDGAGLGGPEAQAALLGAVAEHRLRGGSLSVVARLGPGMDDALLDRLAMEGGGTHDVLVPGEERQLAERLTRPIGLSHAVAAVRFDANAVLRWRLVGHESRVAGAATRPEGGLIPAGEGVYLLFEVKLADGARGSLGTVRVTATQGAAEAALELGAASSEPADAHRAVVAIAAFAEKLRGSYWGKDVGWDALAREVGRLGSPALRDELGDLVGRARRRWVAGPGIEQPVSALRWLP